MARGGLNKNAAVVLGVVVLGLLYYFNTTDSFDPYKVDTNNVSYFHPRGWIPPRSCTAHRCLAYCSALPNSHPSNRSS
jgi:hypothetical protein